MISPRIFFCGTLTTKPGETTIQKKNWVGLLSIQKVVRPPKLTWRAFGRGHIWISLFVHLCMFPQAFGSWLARWLTLQHCHDLIKLGTELLPLFLGMCLHRLNCCMHIIKQTADALRNRRDTAKQLHSQSLNFHISFSSLVPMIRGGLSSPWKMLKFTGPSTTGSAATGAPMAAPSPCSSSSRSSSVSAMSARENCPIHPWAGASCVWPWAGASCAWPSEDDIARKTSANATGPFKNGNGWYLC